MSTQESDSQAGWGFSQYCQWFWSAQTLESNSLPRCVFSITHQSICSNIREDSLAACSAIVSDPDLLKHWGGTHLLDTCSAIISGSNLLKHWGITYKLDVHSDIPSVVLIYSNIKSNSHPGCMFTHSHQQFWYPQKLESNSQPGQVQSLSMIPICWNDREQLTI